MKPVFFYDVSSPYAYLAAARVDDVLSVRPEWRPIAFGVIVRQIGKIARPRRVYIVPDMPKTRSGKIMRRVLAAISNRRDVGDVTTLANPDVVEQIRIMVQGKDVRTTQEALPEDIAKFGQVE